MFVYTISSTTTIISTTITTIIIAITKNHDFDIAQVPKHRLSGKSPLWGFEDNSELSNVSKYIYMTCGCCEKTYICAHAMHFMKIVQKWLEFNDISFDQDMRYRCCGMQELTEGGCTDLCDK